MQVFFLDCNDPESIDNGKFIAAIAEDITVETGSKQIIQQVKYSCIKQYAIHPDSVDVLNCNVTSGRFEPSLPQCVKCQ